MEPHTGGGELMLDHGTRSTALRMGRGPVSPFRVEQDLIGRKRCPAPHSRDRMGLSNLARESAK
jgi:hypothetical protein